MSPKKTILKTLSDLQSEGGSPRPIHPSTIPGFQADPGRYQQTINSLLKERLIEGTKDAEGRMAISLNAHREKEVKKMLRPVWANPIVMALAVVTMAVAGVGLFI